MSSSPSANGRRPRPASRGLGWPVAVSVILAGTVALNLWVMRLASADPSFAVERDYYRKAVDFDQEVARERASATLGWSLVPSVARTGDGATLTVALADREGAPLSDATVVVQAFAVARSADVRTDTLRAAGSAAGDAGHYVARAALGREGLWELRFDVTRGDERWSGVRRVDVAR